MGRVAAEAFRGTELRKYSSEISLRPIPVGTLAAEFAFSSGRKLAMLLLDLAIAAVLPEIGKPRVLTRRKRASMDWIKQLIDVVLHLDKHLESLIEILGLWIYPAMFLVIFCETGLVVTPILPGDSLLFGLGAIAANENYHLSLPWLLGLLIVAAVTGDALNYYLGLRFGERFFRSETSRLFNKKHLMRTQRFYEKYGGKTIVLARFIPIIRTFAPFVAGMGKMEYRRFALYNVTGGIVWVTVFLLGGYFLGDIPIVKNNLILIAGAVVVVSIMPPVIEYFLARLRQTKPEPVAAGAGTGEAE
jgi:membrane-associated protein